MNKFYYKYNIHNFKFTIAQIDDCITTITLDAKNLIKINTKTKDIAKVTGLSEKESFIKPS